LNYSTHTLAAGIAIVAAMIGGACDQDPPKRNYKFVEYVAVRGTCFEDHVKQQANYEGSLVHWRDLDKGYDSRYGSVHRIGLLANTLEEVRNPNKYYPPFMVTFSGLSGEEISGHTLTLKGISSRTEAGPEYESTCLLTVTERLDHLPGKPQGDFGRK
jgi:hypothetical protein